MERVLGRYSEETYALLRIVVGFLFACHGAQKLLGFFGGMADIPPGIRWIAGPIELVGGILIAVGLAASWAAFLASGLMAFAYFLAHHRMETPLPIQNRGELAVVYAWVFLYIASRGSGVWSVDAALREGRRATA
ncbi:MAG TPA: DoxX family protein [Candidatus Binatia bacterium]|nr:DoxX family protein [Candidatus Binatia bacterium]